jgi:hypothetical protein
MPRIPPVGNFHPRHGSPWENAAMAEWPDNIRGLPDPMVVHEIKDLAKTEQFDH